MKKLQTLLPVTLLFIIGIFGLYAASSLITGSIGPDHTFGVFSPAGNAGRITLMNATQANTVGIPGVVVEGDSSSARLTGNFFLQTVGYVDLSASPIRLTPPSGADENVLLPWLVSGNAWSENAGWIALDSQNPNMYSGVYYLPAIGAFTGFAWSNTLGYIDFSGAGASSDAGLVNRVKIIGNVGGAATFESLFVTNNGVMRTASVLTPFINNVRKNVSLRTRNAPDTVINTVATTQKNLGDILYYRISGGTVLLSTISTFCATATSPRSIIVEGGDIVIDRDVTGGGKSCAIIALQDKDVGGNIYITSTPKNIYSYIISEGTVFAGDGPSSLVNDSKIKIANLPKNQLYVLGGVISRNTIGGATTATIARGACPYTESSCDRDNAIKYDLNFFRNYTKSPTNRAYMKDTSMENYSFIIEYDARVAGDPPPGMKNE